MKKLFFIFCLFFIFFESKSQNIIGANIQGIDCNNSTGYIVVDTDVPASWFIFSKYDTVSGSYITIQTGVSDSVSLSYCGSVAVEILNSAFAASDQDTFSVSCAMQSSLRVHQNVKCYGDSTGLLKEIVTGGIPFDPDSIPDSGDEYYDYIWYKNGITYSSGPNDTLIENLVASQYTVNVTDVSGCIFQPIDSATGLPHTSVIAQPSVLRIHELMIDSVHCRGTNTGSFYINMKDGKRYETGNYYNYYLTNVNNDTIRMIDRTGMSLNISSDTTPYYVDFDSLNVGYYSIYVVDSFGCTFDTLIYIPEPDSYSAQISVYPGIICEQDSTWLNIDYINGGYSSIEYNWIDQMPGDSIYARSGTYQIIIYDTVYKCNDTLDYILTAPNTIYTDFISIPASCFGTNTGSIQVDSIYGGVMPYNLQWGGVNPDSLYAGVYTLFITDSLGCVYMEDITVLENDDVYLNSSLYPPSCYGFFDGSIAININGGNPPLSYNWTSGSGSPDSLFSISSGTYILSTVDSLGCSYLDSVTLSDPDSISISFSGYINPLLCNGGLTLINANVTGGTGSYSLSWNTGNVSDTSYQLVAGAGFYTITVVDQNGCSNQNSILITQPELLVVDGSFIQATCNVGGSASVTYSGGTEPVSYIWSNGEITPSVSNLDGGNHWVVVTDSCGDTASYHFVIDSYVLESEADHVNNPINFGEVYVTSSSVGGIFTYQWYDYDMNLINGETDFQIFNLCEGWYFVTVTDSNMCQVTDSIYSTFYLPMGSIVDESTTTVYSDANLWGAEPYTYLWDNGDVTAHGNVCNGVHKVWVTDVNGCEVVGEVIVEDIDLTLSPSDILIECDIANLDVQLEVTASGGIGNYTYLWSSGETMNPINISLFPGVYSVEVTDENFCKKDTVFRIASMSEECIPNVFTPNNDGINDIWNLEDAFLYLDTEVKVYNRYGKLIFKSIGYEDSWDGTNQNGELVKGGVYFYVIDFSNNLEKIKGTVSVIR